MQKSIMFGMLAVGLTACAPNLEVSIKKRWSDSIRNLALRAVYPMREDVFVGTLRLTRAQSEPYSLDSLSLGYVDLSANLNEGYRSQPEFPATKEPTQFTISSDGKKVALNTAWKQSTTSGPSIFASALGDTKRLRQAAIPGLSIAQISEADFARGGPLSVIASAFRRNSTLNLTLKGIESVEIDEVDATKRFYSEVNARLKRDPWFAGTICNSLPKFGVKKLGDVRIEMVTRAFYARAVEYNYGDNASAALRASAGKTAIPSTKDIFKESGVAAGQGNEGNANQGVAAEQSAADVGDTGTVIPGSAARIAAQREEGSSLVEVFERPLAFGVSSISVSPAGLDIDCPAVLKELGWVLAGPLVAPQAATPIRPLPPQAPASSTTTPLGNKNSVSCKQLLKEGNSPLLVEAKRSKGQCSDAS